MEERVSLAEVLVWGYHKFINHGYNFDIRMELFRDRKRPVIHISDTNGEPQWDFPIILDIYEPKHPDSDDWDGADKVIIDRNKVERTFHEEIRKFYQDYYNKERKEE
jgi:hypothetical protein